MSFRDVGSIMGGTGHDPRDSVGLRAKADSVTEFDVLEMNGTAAK